MLLPDNIQPEMTLYYIGSRILAELKKSGVLSLLDLFQTLKDNNSSLSFRSLLLSLDWLYLIGAAEIDSNGEVHLCL